MASIHPVKYNAVYPNDEPLKKVNSNFSGLYLDKPMYVVCPERPIVLVQANYGDATPQAQLKDEYISGNVRKTVGYFNFPSMSTEWVKAWQKYADEHVNASTTRAKRTPKLQFSKLITASEYNNTPRVKMTIPSDVLDLCCKECGRDTEDIFNLPHGSYTVVFTLSGIWKNATSYGFTVKALRISLRSPHSPPKRIKPSDYIIPEEDVDGDDTSVVEDSQLS